MWFWLHVKYNQTVCALTVTVTNWVWRTNSRVYKWHWHIDTDWRMRVWLLLSVRQIFQTVSRSDTGRYYCEAKNGVGYPKRCESTHMQIGKMCDISNLVSLWTTLLSWLSPSLSSDDLNVPAVITGVVVVCILVILCTFGVCYAHRQGYFSRKFKSLFVFMCIFCWFICSLSWIISGVNKGTQMRIIHVLTFFLFVHHTQGTEEGKIKKLS